MRPSNTCFLTVMWQNSLGIWFIPCSTYNHLLSYPICWVLGSRISPKLRNQVLVDAATLCWVVWFCMNDVVFDGKKFISLICRSSSEEPTGQGNGQHYPKRKKRLPRSSAVSAWKEWLWRSFKRQDGTSEEEFSCSCG